MSAKKLMYNDYVRRLSRRFSAELETIRVTYNFDYGDEFEIALCRVLRLFLPTRYGICRGFVVGSDGEEAGDDIIIFDQQSFPTVGLRDLGDFSRKEYIPAEAVYAYIEAKNSMHLDKNCGQSLAKAVEQVKAVKSLCNKRKARGLEDLGVVTVSRGSVRVADGYPEIRNPSWGAIFARRSTVDGMSITDPEVVIKATEGGVLGGSCHNGVDLMVFGAEMILIPVLPVDESVSQMSLFWLECQTEYELVSKPELGFGLGVLQLLGALDWIELGSMPWSKVLIEVLGEQE